MRCANSWIDSQQGNKRTEEDVYPKGFEMREIKFRFWNTIFNRFEKEGYVISHDFFNLPHGVVPEQFTGLKDKNGKEIFEGDLVEVLHTEGISWEQNYRSKGVVEFGSQGAFVVKCLKKGCENAKDISKRYFYLAFNPKREVTVLGIIHETHLQTNLTEI